MNNQENIVPAERQNATNIFTGTGSGLRVLFAGNSITKHGIKADIGWTRDCGMAASDEAHDYVHLLMAKIRAIDPNASYMIAQVADYERGFYTMHPADGYQAAADYHPDLVLMFFGANVAQAYDTETNPPRTFGEAYDELRTFLRTGRDTAVFHSAGFYIRPKLDAEKKAVAEKYGEPFISLDDIIARDDVRGMFNHPGDLGMQLLADRFFSCMEPVIREKCGK